MYLLASRGSAGAYAVIETYGEHVLYLFEDEDDADRYLMLLKENGTKHDKLSVLEVEDDLAMKACESYNYKYAIIGKEDIVIPPVEE